MWGFDGDRTHLFHNVKNGFNLVALGKVAIFDVGGGVGTASKVLTKAFHLLSFIVDDQPEVVATNAVVGEDDTRLRIRYLGHNVFSSIGSGP